jgi:SAM-dependent methyltransferase
MSFDHYPQGVPPELPPAEAVQPIDIGGEAQRLTVAQSLAQLAIRAQQAVITTFERSHFFPKVAERLAGELGDAALVLDFGSGKGYLGDALQASMPNAKVVSTDIGDDHQGETPFVLASGDSLPFRDKAFDVATIFYVLHHFDRPEDALSEAMRVSGRLIVQEDTYKNGWQKWWYQKHIDSYKLNSPESGGGIKTDEEWRELFAREGLAITALRRVRKVGYPVTRWEYQLEQNVASEKDR